MTRALAATAILVLTASEAARGEEFADKVAKTTEAVSAGRRVVEDVDYPSDAQVFTFSTGRGMSTLWYTIDLRAHLCFVQTMGPARSSPASVPCQNLKKGYPLVAPLITWSD